MKKPKLATILTAASETRRLNEIRRLNGKANEIKLFRFFLRPTRNI